LWGKMSLFGKGLEGIGVFKVKDVFGPGPS